MTDQFRVGGSPRRKEDGPLLTGSGRFLDDLRFTEVLHLGVVRSPHAHARISKLSLAEARALPGVVAAFGPADLTEIRTGIPPAISAGRFHPYTQPVLAVEKVRYVGEPIAVVVASDPYRLDDALPAVRTEYEPLAPVLTVDDGFRPDWSRVHEEWPGNIAGVSQASVGAVDCALSQAEVVVEGRFRYPRCAPMPLEPRGVIATWDDVSGILTVWSSTQATHRVRTSIAAILGLAAEQVRVIAPDIGGAFGGKAQVYSEEILVPAVARRLRRPVKWVETRREHFLSACHDRDQLHEVRIGLRRDGTIVGLEDRFCKDFGAYPIQEDGVTLNTVNHLPGPYRVPAYRSTGYNLVTNKTFSAAYRGAGRPEAAFVMDRVLDVAARRLGLDPAELRRRNLVRPDEMPYRPGLTYKDGVPISYDPGDFPAAFEKALELLGYVDYRRLQTAQSRTSRRIGLGLSCYVEGTALGPFEGANVRVDPSGKVYVFIGVSSQGQGHATTLAQICAEHLGVDFDDVTVKGADTDVLPYGIGAMASRIAALAGPAVARATREVREKATLVAAELFECAPHDIRIEQGRVHVAGAPGRSLPLAQVAQAATRTAVLAGTSGPGLNGCCYFYPETVTWAFGANAAAVEVDIETCAIRVLKYVAVHDSGRPIHPVIVEGQLHGGVVQGLGAALMEDLIYDAQGQLITGSFMDYAIPKADQLPPIVTAHLDHPSVINELGIKGVGESGAISPAAVIANAVEDALAEFEVTVYEAPITPAKLFDLLARARARELQASPRSTVPPLRPMGSPTVGRPVW
jgi:carbon-monoxide dehydrogenase large subunit